MTKEKKGSASKPSQLLVDLWKFIKTCVRQLDSWRVFPLAVLWLVILIGATSLLYHPPMRQLALSGIIGATSFSFLCLITTIVAGLGFPLGFLKSENDCRIGAFIRDGWREASKFTVDAGVGLVVFGMLTAFLGGIYNGAIGCSVVIALVLYPALLVAFMVSIYVLVEANSGGLKKERNSAAGPDSAVESAATALVSLVSDEDAPNSRVVGSESSVGHKSAGNGSLRVAAFSAALIVGSIVALAIFVVPVVFADMLESYQEALRSTSARGAAAGL